MAKETKIKCNFRCLSVTKQEDQSQTKKNANKFLYNAQFAAATEGKDESKGFFASAPGGILGLWCYQTDCFEVGKTYTFEMAIFET